MVGKRTRESCHGELSAHWGFMGRISREATEQVVCSPPTVSGKAWSGKYYRVRMLPSKNSGGKAKDRGICKGAIIIMNVESDMNKEEVRT